MSATPNCDTTDTTKLSFCGKVVLVTGASSGIGAATAEFFAKRGASLSLVARNLDSLKQVAEKCFGYGKCLKPLIVNCDLNDNCSKKIIESTIYEYGKLDVLVNNAGIFCYDSVEAIDIGNFDKIIGTNLRSVIQLTNEAVPHLLHSKGCIVNVSSYLGQRSVPNVLSYSISKAGLDQFTKCIAMELAGKGVRVNSVNPGVILTDIHRRSGMSEEAYATYLESCKKTHPLGRAGFANEVASAIAFLASDDAGFMTGVLVPVDGGKQAFSTR